MDQKGADSEVTGNTERAAYASALIADTAVMFAIKFTMHL
jgi:hypothetical protein